MLYWRRYSILLAVTLVSVMRPIGAYALQMFRMVGIVWIITLIFVAIVSVIKPWGGIGKAKDEVEPSQVGTT